MDAATARELLQFKAKACSLGPLALSRSVAAKSRMPAAASLHPYSIEIGPGISGLCVLETGGAGLTKDVALDGSEGR